MAAIATKNASREVRYTKAPIAQKIKMGGRVVVSSAFVKSNATNLVPHLHVRSGDTVMLIVGSKEDGKGTTGKVQKVFPKEGKIIVEGINVQTNFQRQKGPAQQGGIIKREGKIFASKVMLFCTACKKPTRIKHKTLDNGKKSRVCKHCNNLFDA